MVQDVYHSGLRFYLKFLVHIVSPLFIINPLALLPKYLIHQTMHKFSILALAVLAAASDSWKAGLHDAATITSVSGNAICVQGNVAVSAATSKNLKLELPNATNQTVVTETIIEMLMAGSTFMQNAIKGTTSISGTFNISVRLCHPKSGATSKTIQFLTHGVGFDKSYWDVAPGYSYIDAAAAKGYSTFSYDRLGVGLSDHPEANLILQAPLELEIAHSLIQMLRSGKFASTAYSHVVGTGHSYGSAITQAITAQYPADLDAAVLTGFTLNSTGQATFSTSLDLTIASENCPSRFQNLSNGYLVTNNIVGNQFAFFKAQGFPPANLVIAENTKQTVSFGELITLSTIIAPATEFTGAIDVVNGDSDWPFCLGNCSVPVNLAQAVKGLLYPKASNQSQYYLAENCGHGINLHYAAVAVYSQIQTFIKSVGL
jgi:pimeloyl-ACP methyl ester carboxylesterase